MVRVHSTLLLGVGLEVLQGAALHLARHVAHIGVVHRGHKARRLPGEAHLGVHLVDLLQGQVLGLVDAHVHEHGAHEAEAAPDEEDLGLQVRVARPGVDHVRRRVGDGPVEQPVGRRRDRQAPRARLEREQLTRHNPGDGAPRAGEEEDVDADKGDEHLVGHDRRGRRADDGDDVLAHKHAHGAEEQQRPPSPLLDHPEAGEGGDDVDDVGDQGDDKGVLDAGVLEVRGTVVDWTRVSRRFVDE